MHESDAKCLIRPVLDFFIATKFDLDPSVDEYDAALNCFLDFVKDREPYWVREKAVHVIRCLLDFESVIGDSPPSLKEAVLAVAREVRKSLTKEVWDERLEKDSDTVRLDIGNPTFIRLEGWGRQDWTRPRKPPAD